MQTSRARIISPQITIYIQGASNFKCLPPYLNLSAKRSVKNSKLLTHYSYIVDCHFPQVVFRKKTLLANYFQDF